MSKQADKPREQSWRDIRQSVNPRAMTTEGRKRLGWNLARTTFSILTVGVLGGIGFYLWQGFEQPSETLAPVVKAEPLSEVIVLTDGVLTKDWVLSRLALADGISLMAVDLDLAKLQLEREGQVRTAVIARQFPGTLVVTIEERAPVVRIMVPLEPGRPEALFVSRDGQIYRGFNYDTSMVADLPWLDGVRLRRLGSGFVPLEGVDRISELLLIARTEAPQLAATWRVISLAETPRMLVKTTEVNEIVFEPGNHRRQLARLDYIVDHFRLEENRQLRPARIDLSIALQVAVDLEGSKLLPAADRDPDPRAQSISSFIRNIPNTRKNRGL